MRARYKLRFTMRFYSELERIFGYIALRSPHQARRTVARILREVEALKWFPHRSIVESEGSTQPLRKLPIPPFVAFFRVDERLRVVHLLWIRHGARSVDE